MKRLPRDPLRFDVFKAFAEYGKEQRFSLGKPETTEGFVETFRASVKQSLKNEAFLHGLRTEAMFEALIANLGHVQILKQEDAGDIYVDDEILRVPDFRLVLAEGSQMLVEVKNFYEAKDHMKPFAVTEDYLGGLVRYSELMWCDLLVAIYWVKWNQWTLVSPLVFEKRNGLSVVSFPNAMCFNHMSAVGDFLVGTKFPLRVRFIADKGKPRSVDPDGQAIFHISNIEFYCEENLITDPLEQSIAFYLVNYGKWEEEPTEAHIIEKQLEYIEFRWNPEEDHGQGFEIIGSLSSMFSTFYREVTLEEGRVAQLQVDIAPGSLGRLIPQDYKGDALPLWRFQLRPGDSGPDVAEPHGEP